MPAEIGISDARFGPSDPELLGKDTLHEVLEQKVGSANSATLAPGPPSPPDGKKSEFTWSSKCSPYPKTPLPKGFQRLGQRFSALEKILAKSNSQKIGSQATGQSGKWGKKPDFTEIPEWTYKLKNHPGGSKIAQGVRKTGSQPPPKPASRSKRRFKWKRR